MRAVAIALALGCSMGMPSQAWAAETVSGVTFTEQAGSGAEALDLCSAGLLRWKRIVKAYVAALYLDDCGSLSRPLVDVPKRLELSYLRGFRAAQFAGAAQAILDRSFDTRILAPLRERIARMHRAYQPVVAGDRYALTYRRGVGTELALNGQPLVVIEGADFAAAYFAIWLGEDPADARLRDRLLEPRSRR